MRFHAEEGLVKNLNYDPKIMTISDQSACAIAERETPTNGLPSGRRSVISYFRPCLLATIGILLCVSAGWAAATDVYVTQNGAGGQNGTNLANAFPIGALSSSSNCGSGFNQIGPDTVVHINANASGTGTANFPANGTMFSFQCDGTNGHPVILQFQAGDIWQAPYFSASAAIQISNRSFVTIDLGGATIQDTLNGTPGFTCPGGPCTSQKLSVLIQALHCNTCEIRNGTLANVYVHQQCEGNSKCDGSGDTNHNAIQYGGPNFKAHDLTMHDVTWAMLENASVGDDNIQIYNNDIYHMDHGIACGAGPGVTVGHFYIHDNHFHDMAIFDTGVLDANHHDGIHCFSSLNTGKIQNIYIYNNLFDGNQGQCCVTAWVFLEGGSGSGATPWTDKTGTAYVFNNVFVGSLDIGNGQLSVDAGTGHKIYNNVIMQTGPQQSGGKCFNARGSAGTEAITFVNNAVQGCAQAYSFDNAVSIVAMNNNAYANLTGQGNETFNWTGHTNGNVNSLSAWRSVCNCDANSVGGTSGTLSLSNTGIPQTGSMVVGIGTNLTSAGIAGLTLDKAGNPRPSTGAWDVGAYSSGVTSSLPAPPDGLKAVVD